MYHRRFLDSVVSSVFALLLLAGCDDGLFAGWFDGGESIDSGVFPVEPNPQKDAGSTLEIDAGEPDELKDAGDIDDTGDAGLFDSGTDWMDGGGRGR